MFDILENIESFEYVNDVDIVYDIEVENNVTCQELVMPDTKIISWKIY